MLTALIAEETAGKGSCSAHEVRARLLAWRTSLASQRRQRKKSQKAKGRRATMATDFRRRKCARTSCVTFGAMRLVITLHRKISKSGRRASGSGKQRAARLVQRAERSRAGGAAI